MACEYLGYTQFRSDRESSPPTVDRRVLRNVGNPFHLGPTEFKKLYRLSPNLADDLVWQRAGHLRGSRVTAIKTEKQVLAALRFFATGCFHRPVGEQSSISRSIHRVAGAIYHNMFCSK
ncbi:uncharacterized protein LOC118756770, partial [Rhagoletis pomonella]|uniref:uncharacterized protein LOC118756770 n=1 Tax=Rhagoletis pomonella TaxID=28610 RepID=UPI00177A8091